MAAPKAMPLPNVVAVAPPKVVRPFVAPPVMTHAAGSAGCRCCRKRRAPRPMPMTVAPVRSGDAEADRRAPSRRRPTCACSGRRRAAAGRSGSREMVVEPNALPFAPTRARAPAAGIRCRRLRNRGRWPRRLCRRPGGGGRAAPQRTWTRCRAPSCRRRAGRCPHAAPGDLRRAAHPRRSTRRATAEASLAIVGLNPAKTTDVPAPPGSRAGGFLGGSRAAARKAGTGANGIALLNVPGLVVKGGAKDTQPTLVAPFSPTSRENLLAAARMRGGCRRRASQPRPERRAVAERRIRGWPGAWCTASPSRCRM